VQHVAEQPYFHIVSICFFFFRQTKEALSAEKQSNSAQLNADKEKLRSEIDSLSKVLRFCLL